MMSIVFKYARQYPWRSWQFILDALPLLQDQSVLDLGCGIGDVSSVLANRGAHVVGIAESMDLLQLGVEVTDANAAFFDAANGFCGCIAGLHEMLRRQGLLEGIWCLDELETLSLGQAREIDRVMLAYPHLNDNAFIAEHLDDWLQI